jgi:hypothetical protein
MSTRVTTKKVRLSYVNVFKARAMEEGETPKYSSAILIPKKDLVTVAAIEAAVEAAIAEGKKSKYGPGALIMSKFKKPLRDGDEEKPDDEAYAGMWFLNASSIRKPLVLGSDRNLLEDESEIYSGVWARVVLNFFPFAGKSKGVAVGLESVMKVDDGENLGSGMSLAEAQNAFGGDEDDDIL